MSKDELLKEALNIINESGLSNDDKVMWREHLSVANTRLLKMIIDTISSGNNVIEAATKSLKEKMKTEGDREKLQIVINTEKDEIKSILNG